MKSVLVILSALLLADDVLAGGLADNTTTGNNTAANAIAASAAALNATPANTTAVTATTVSVTTTTASVASSPTRQCILPNADGHFETASASELNVDQALLNKAIVDTSKNGSISIKVFRNNCLIGSSQALYPDAKSDNINKNIYSATKGVISILTGIAYEQGYLQLDDRIDKYLPRSILNNWGDLIHRSITIRQLLTETAGTASDLITEAKTVFEDLSIPQQALAAPMTHIPGTFFKYSQRVVDLMAYIVSRAVRQELQAFAQQYLFTPIGIPVDRYIWLRDRSYNTYGYAWLYLTNDDFARIALLLQNGGIYNGNRVVSQGYVDLAATPSPMNGCYGFLFWTNRVSPTSPKFDTCHAPDGYLFHRSWVPSAPRDLFAISGSPFQKNIMIPSLNMSVSFMSVLVDYSPESDGVYKFFKTLISGIRDPGFVIPGPGTYEIEPDPPMAIQLKQAETNLMAVELAMSPTCSRKLCTVGVFMGGKLNDSDKGWAFAKRVVGYMVGLVRRLTGA
ncbi:beta-lactamase/transpeptidase-like protein [Thozetella sp. PMI_491]|nr:beta-lactamase/transpeptidase-like protein [Thozetella sp. PMI_491]